MKIGEFIQETLKTRVEHAGALVLYDPARIRLDNGWVIKVGRGFDIYQKIDRPRSGLAMNDFDLRPCLETKVDIFRESK